nr:MAG TPA: hypothetical protein [Caudoviricetes sp.]
MTQVYCLCIYSNRYPSPSLNNGVLDTFFDYSVYKSSRNPKACTHCNSKMST